MTEVHDAEKQLILAGGTVAPSTTFADFADAAAANGFVGVTLPMPMYVRAEAAGWFAGDLRAIADGHGLDVEEVGPLWQWVPGSDEYGYRGHHVEPEMVFEVAATLGAKVVTALAFMSPRQHLLSYDEYAEAFANLCDRASGYDLRVGLEFVPWAKIGDASAAQRVVSLAGSPNGGVIVDSWHFFRGTLDVGVLRDIPSGGIVSFQIADAPAFAEEDLLSETAHRRLLPGDGDQKLDQLVRAMDEIAPDLPVTVEVFSDTLHQMTASDAAGEAASSTRRLIDHAFHDPEGVSC